MTPDRTALLRILAIAHDTSMRGEGLSLQQALARTDYAKLRQHFSVSDLLDLIQANPDLIEQWVAYSEDKRTTGGFWLTRQGVVGAMDRGSQSFASMPRATAEYVLLELDFWIGLEDAEPPPRKN